jgi:hypothetical protein
MLVGQYSRDCNSPVTRILSVGRTLLRNPNTAQAVSLLCIASLWKLEITLHSLREALCKLTRIVQIHKREMGNFKWTITKRINFPMRPALIFRKVQGVPFTLQMEAACSTETGVSNC